MFGIRPPFRFRETSPCPGLDRLVSGLNPVTNRALTRRTLLPAFYRFRFAFLLATRMNSLPRFSKRTTESSALASSVTRLTIGTWFQALLIGCYPFFSALRACCRISLRNFSLFWPLNNPIEYNFLLSP